MKIKYLGIQGVAQSRSHGCPVCGRKSTQRETRPLKYMFKITLPSGLTQVYRIGKEYEVNETDGQFLLDFVYKDSKGVQKPFVKV